MYFKAKNMDNNIHFLSQKTPETEHKFLIPRPKNVPKNKWKFYVFPFFVVAVVVWYGGYMKLFADPTPMAPNSVLDPTCAPGDSGCYVQFLPIMSTSTANKVLSNDGSLSTWIDQNGGVFSLAGGQITRGGWTGVSSSTLGSATTTLAQFIQNVFFPAPSWIAYTTTNPTSGTTQHTSVATTGPTASFNLSAFSGSTQPICSGSNCELFGSSRANVTLAYTTVSPYTVTTTYQHKWVVCSYDSGTHTATSSDTCGGTSATAAVVTTNQTAGRNDGTLASHDVVFSTGGHVALNNITAVKLKTTTGNICSVNQTSFVPISGSFCSSINPISASGATGVAVPGVALDYSGGGAGSTYTIEVDSSSGNSTGSASTLSSFLPKVYALATSTDLLSSGTSATVVQNAFINLTNSTDCGASSNVAPCSLLTTTSTRTISADLASQYFYYAIPTNYSVGNINSCYNTFVGCSASQNIKVGGTRDNGWGRRTISFTNNSGYTQNYDIYGYPYDLTHSNMAGALTAPGQTFQFP